MGFFEKMIQRLLLVLQFILVFLFILFEEIIWETIAKPIYEKIDSLHLLERLEQKIQKSNRYALLTIFTILLLAVEGAGLLAGVFFVQGQILLGLLLYVAKIPIAAFVFWLFKVAKEKLLSFDWFNWSYEKLMGGVEWLKNREIYRQTIHFMQELKAKIKQRWQKVKAKYFTKESAFMKELKAFYDYMKNFKRNSKKEDKKDD